MTEQDTSGTPERTGTYPFIAIDILQGAATGLGATHLYRHDLESFLYVLLWVSCYPVPPTPSPTSTTSSAPKRAGDVFWPHDDPFHSWISQSEGTVASLKMANIVSTERIFAQLLACFDPASSGSRT